LPCVLLANPISSPSPGFIATKYAPKAGFIMRAEVDPTVRAPDIKPSAHAGFDREPVPVCFFTRWPIYWWRR